jgi:hypothetical protein
MALRGALAAVKYKLPGRAVGSLEDPTEASPQKPSHPLQAQLEKLVKECVDHSPPNFMSKADDWKIQPNGLADLIQFLDNPEIPLKDLNFNAIIDRKDGTTGTVLCYLAWYNYTCQKSETRFPIFPNVLTLPGLDFDAELTFAYKTKYRGNSALLMTVIHLFRERHPDAIVIFKVLLATKTNWNSFGDEWPNYTALFVLAQDSQKNPEAWAALEWLLEKPNLDLKLDGVACGHNLKSYFTPEKIKKFDFLVARRNMSRLHREIEDAKSEGKEALGQKTIAENQALFSQNLATATQLADQLGDNFAQPFVFHHYLLLAEYYLKYDDNLKQFFNYFRKFQVRNTVSNEDGFLEIIEKARTKVMLVQDQTLLSQYWFQLFQLVQKQHLGAKAEEIGAAYIGPAPVIFSGAVKAQVEKGAADHIKVILNPDLGTVRGDALLLLREYLKTLGEREQLKVDNEAKEAKLQAQIADLQKQMAALSVKPPSDEDQFFAEMEQLRERSAASPRKP